MSDFISARDAISPAFIAEVCGRIAEGERVYRVLPDGGRLHIERPLPFLCVHRTRANDAGGAELLLGQSSFIVAPRSPELAALVDAITRALADKFGAVLLLEIWTGAGESDDENQAIFRIFSGEEASATPVETARLQDALSEMNWPPFAVQTRVEPLENALGWQPFLDENAAKMRSCRVLGLEVPPRFREAPGGPIFPASLRQLRRELGLALQKTCADFMKVQTVETIEDFRALGLRQLDDAVWQVDGEIAEIAANWNFLLGVTPVNAPAEWEKFAANNYQKTPVFHDRLLPFDPDLLKRQLYNIELERVESPALQALFHQKRLELDRQITLLEDRQTPRFLPGSMALYGGIEAPLLELAKQILARTSADDDGGGARIEARALAARAQREIDFYRLQFPELSSQVEVRADVPGVMVAAGQLLIGEHFSYAAAQLEDLIAHEVGTHIVSHANGRAQPLRLLHIGFPDYDPLQEGTALLAEWLGGGLHPSRLRLLAARVWAVDSLIRGADFVETFRALHHEFGYDARAAWSLTMRVYRGGGLVKDAVYLRGLAQLLDYLSGENAEWELLWSGKISIETLPLVRELHLRGVLQPMRLRPRFLDETGAGQKLRKLRAGLTVLDLLAEISS